MAKRRKPQKLLIVQFLVPVRGRDGALYPRTVHEELGRELEERFDGWSRLGDRPLPGAWRNPESGEIEHDESWRYEVGVARERLRELDDCLATLAHRLGQKAIWRVVFERTAAKAIAAHPPRRGRGGGPS